MILHLQNGTLHSEKDYRVLCGLLVLSYSVGDGLDQVILVKGYPVEPVLVRAHRFLETACSARLVDLYHPLIFVNLEEWADVMGLSHHQAVIAGFDTEIFVFETGFDKHGRRRARVDCYVDCSALKHFVLLNQGLNFGFGLFGLLL